MNFKLEFMIHILGESVYNSLKKFFLRSKVPNKFTFGNACLTVSSSSVSVNELDESLELSSSKAGLK